MKSYRLFVFAAVLAFADAVVAAESAPEPLAVRDIAGWHTWLRLEVRKIHVGEELDFDLSAALHAWSARRDELSNIKAKWSRAPAPLPWNELALELIVKYQQNPLRAARSLALLHAAMSDAAIVAARAERSAHAQAVAIHAAASGVLTYLYPQESAGRFEALGRVAYIAIALDHGAPEALDAGWRIGRRVAASAIARALDDGASVLWNPDERPAAVPGRWRSAPPLNLYNPLEAFAGKWRPWVLESGGEINPPLPVLFDSEAYWQEAEHVLRTTRELTLEQKRIADEWNLDSGSVTPAGVWNLRARRLLESTKSGTGDAAQVLAVLNVAMADAFIACWHAKFEHWTQRPVHAIRDRLDPNFLPYLITPAFPGYVSGHATVSGAAAEVLAAFFPDAAKEVREMGEEAARSRLYGGIHFQSDNDEGLKLGRTIGRRVASVALSVTEADGLPARPRAGGSIHFSR